MSKKIAIETTPTKALVDQVKEAYENFGRYVNLERAIPSVLDGLKPSYRKVIYGTMQAAGNKLEPVPNIVGEVNKYYNHGTQYIPPIISRLARVGIFMEEGNHGNMYHFSNKNEREAAARYLFTCVNDYWYQLFAKLLPYVPYQISDKGGREPVYIPTPIPIGLTIGYTGMGCGCNTEIPPLTPQSMLKASVEDNPKHLRMRYGLTILQNQSNLEGIWTRGSGKLTFKYPTKVTEYQGRKGIMIGGRPIFQELHWGIDKLKRGYTIESLVKKGEIGYYEINNYKEVDGIGFTDRKLFIYLTNKASIGFDELELLVETVVTNYRLIKLSVVMNNQVIRIPLRNWLTLSYGNYTKLLSEYRQTNIDKYKFQKLVWEWLPKVAEILFRESSKGNNITNKQIAEELKIEEAIVSEIMGKPISSLRRKDTTSQIKAAQDKIEEFTKFSPEEFTMTAIQNIPST